MAKVPSSKCAAGVVGAAVETVAKGLDPAEVKLADDFLKNLFRPNRFAGESGVNAANIIMESTVDTLLKVAREPAEKGMTKSWVTKTEMPAVGQEATEREIRNLGAMHQHRLVGGQSDILAQTRSYYEIQKKVPEGAPLSKEATLDLINRLDASAGMIKAMGIPVVSMKQGGSHFSFLAVPDIFKIMMRPIGSGSKENELIEGFLRAPDPTKNIPFQNVAEAVRRIIEADDLRIPFAGDDLEKLKGDVLDALVNSAGKAVDKDAKVAMEATRAWMMSDEGRVIVAKVADALTDADVMTAFVKENLVQKQIALAFQRADGIKMTQQALDTIASSPFLSDNLDGLGALMLDDGLRKIFGNDFMVKFSPDGVNLAFGQQFLAKVLGSLTPENLAHVTETSRAIRAARKDSAKRGSKSPHANKNKDRKRTNDEVSEKAAKMAEDAVENDANVRVDTPTPEGSKVAQKFYNELKYGAVMGKMAKVVGLVSDRATMSSKGKTMLMNSEHISLESAGTITAGLRKLNDSIGGDAERANRIFANIARGLGKGQNAKDEMLAALDEADREFAGNLIDYIDALFGAGANNRLMQNNIFVEDLIESLKAVGLRKASDDFASSGAVHADDILDYWRNFPVEEGSNILDYMGKFYAAQQLSMVAPTMADSLVRHFSHTAEGLSYAQAKKEGWFALDTQKKSGLGKYMDVDDKKPPLFPPEFKSRIQSIEDYLNFDRNLPSNRMGDFIRRVDQVTSVMKSSITLWRPGHHMVSHFGNVLMNTLAGVAPSDYILAVKMLRARKDVFDIDDVALNELARLQAPAGKQLKADGLEFITVGGRKLSIEDAVLAAERYNAVINPRRVRDVVTTDDLGSGAFSASRLLTKNPVARGIEGVDHEIARFAAVRDNFSRLALFIKELRTMGPTKSMEDAFISAASRVHEYHPTVGTLTGPERKIARRVFYFYTWQKQAFFKIMEVAANSPALITVPSKLQFAIATAQGMDPESFGDPFSAHGWFAGYNMATVYGPQWDDPKYGAMGIKPPFPQLDVIDSYLSGVRFNPADGLWTNIGSLATSSASQIIGNQVAPIFRVPAELLTNRKQTTGQEIVPGGGFDAAKYGEYAIDQTGLGSLSRIYDWTPWGPRTDTRLDPYSDFNRDRQWWNFLGGMKITAFESPAAMQRARQEAINYYQKLYQTGKYAERPSLAEFQEMKEPNE